MNAIVFALRGCPAGWLGAYGNEWVATPNLDRLAAESVVFDRHISDKPSQAGANRAWLPSGPPSGVKSVLIRANHPETDSPADFYAGWSEVFDARPQEGDASPLDSMIRELPNVLDRIASESRALIWIDIDRLLPPWEVPQDVFEAYIADEGEELEKIEPLADPEEGPFDKSDAAAWEWLHSSFAAVVTTLDAELGSVFELLRERGLDKTATWIVTSDFGYPLGEHGCVGAARSDLHEELVHVPLIVRLPNEAEAGRRVDGFTRPEDVARFLEPDAQARVDIEPLLARRVPDYAISRSDTGAAIRTDRWAFLLPLESDRKPMLFVKPDDRWEVHDVLSLHEDAAEELEQKLRLTLT